MSKLLSDVWQPRGAEKPQQSILLFFLSTIFLITFFHATISFAGSKSAAEEVSDVVENLCPALAGLNRDSAANDLFNRCGEVKIGLYIPGQESYDDLSPAQKMGLYGMASDETTSMRTMSVEITQAQFATVVGRLETIRSQLPGTLALNTPSRKQREILYAGPITYLASAGDDIPGRMENSGKWGLFLNGGYGTGERDTSFLEPGFDFDQYGLIGGVDYRFTDRFVLGGAFGYSNVKADIDNNAGDTESKGYAFSLYGLYYLRNFYLNAVGSIGTRDFDTVRNVNYTIFDLPVRQRFVGSTDATDYDLSVGAGYDFRSGRLTIGPYAQFRYFKTEIDGYSERLAMANTNPGYGTALGISDQTIKSVTSNVGGQLSWAHSTKMGILQPFLRLGWIHEYENDSRTIRAMFLNVPDDPVAASYNHIRINTDPPDENYYDLALGMSVVCPRGFQTFINYRTLLDLENVTSHLVSVGIRFEI